MEYYELNPGIYRIQAGVGSDGEIFGGIFLKDNPNIIIGASGGKKFVDALRSVLDGIDSPNPIRIYLPHVTYEELTTAYEIQRKFPDINFYVHVNVLDDFKQPRDNFLESRYFLDERDLKHLNKYLPRSLENVLGYDKAASFETEGTKILIIPFPGPQVGHSFIYSRDHKLLCAGIALGRTSDPYSYYLDRSGSIEQMKNALSFLQKAQSEIIFPAYDEPEFSKSLQFKAGNIADAINDEKSNLKDLLTQNWMDFDQIVTNFVEYHAHSHQTQPYDRIDLHRPKIYHLLNDLVTNKQVAKKENQYRLN